MTDDKVKKEVFHPAMSDVKVTLKNAPLWKQFYKEGTEMIITKSGRRMFPSLRLGLSGLEEDGRYFVLLETALSDGHRYKFSTSEWSIVGTAEPQTHSSTRLYIHPDSPATGSTWMSQDVLFHRVKLTNNTLDRSGNLVLTSMHKYQPRIHIIKASDILALHWSPTVTFTFPETEFIAVTAYQNEKITKLKIDNNPFAKGFRENGQARTKRKLQTLESTDVKKDETYAENDCHLAETKKHCESTNNHDSDSGVSVGSVTPPLEEPSQQQECSKSSRERYPAISISDVPQPTFYHPHTFWPVTPLLFQSYPPTPYHHHPPQTYPVYPPPPFPIPVPFAYHHPHSSDTGLIDLSIRSAEYTARSKH